MSRACPAERDKHGVYPDPGALIKPQFAVCQPPSGENRRPRNETTPPETRAAKSALVTWVFEKYPRWVADGALDRLFELIQVLRGDNGCPWDRAQTVGDILSDLVEETYELQWAQAHRSPREVFDETGDVLFVLVFAIALLREKDPSFNLETIAQHAHDKIRRRHPHVFGDAVATTPGESVAHWNRVKSEEKREKPDQSRSLSEIPSNLPPLRRAEKIQRLAAGSGFDWSDTSGILRKIREEIDEVEGLLPHGTASELSEEIGDLFFSVVNLSRFLNIDSEASITSANAKFLDRYRAMEELARLDGQRLEDLTLEEMDRYWEQTKKPRP